jgi:hypothetical protein
VVVRGYLRLCRSTGYHSRIVRRRPLPGVLFLDACGDVAGAIPGRQPGADQTRTIVETLERLAKAPARCPKT